MIASEPEFLNFTKVQWHASSTDRYLYKRQLGFGFGLVSRYKYEFADHEEEDIDGKGCRTVRAWVGWTKHGRGLACQNSVASHPRAISNPFVGRPPSVRSHAQYSAAPRRLAPLHPDGRNDCRIYWVTIVTRLTSSGQYQEIQFNIRTG